ncbi:MAG TPA: HEAT repeat domain-containing protein, partial [Clostridia bacterium]|nr:HEAT repeat domain-containing protein [Clostridia bacterium]
ASLLLSGQPVIHELINALNDPQWEVRLAAVKALGQLSWKAQPAVPALTDSLQDEYPLVREWSARTLGKMGMISQPAIPYLLRLTEDNAENVSAAAREALAKIETPETTDRH